MLYGRDLPAQFKRCKQSDFAANVVDLFFTMGSSLTVQPACRLPNEAGATCHRVLVNRDGAGNFDLFGRQRHRMVVESNRAPSASGNAQEAVNTAIKGSLNSMLDKYKEWEAQLKRNGDRVSRTNATAVKAAEAELMKNADIISRTNALIAKAAGIVEGGTT